MAERHYWDQTYFVGVYSFQSCLILVLCLRTLNDTLKYETAHQTTQYLLNNKLVVHNPSAFLLLFVIHSVISCFLFLKRFLSTLYHDFGVWQAQSWISNNAQVHPLALSCLVLLCACLQAWYTFLWVCWLTKRQHFWAHTTQSEGFAYSQTSSTVRWASMPNSETECFGF